MAGTLRSLGCESLDDVELIMALEDTLAVSFRDDELQRVLTLGDMLDLCVVKLAASKGRQSRCLSRSAFFRLRAALLAQGYAGRHSPRTSLRAVMGRRRIKHAWRAFEAASGLRLPPLQLTASSWIVIGGMVTCSALVALASGSWLPLVCGSCLGIASTRLLPVEVPAAAATLGELTTGVVAYNYARLTARHAERHRDDIWKVMVRITADQLGHPAERLGRETRFYDPK